jgi:hypothetical protein
VGPPPSAIHGRGRLSRHPCRSAHSAPPAFSLHPSRDVWYLACCGMKIKSESRFALFGSSTRVTGLAQTLWELTC